MVAIIAMISAPIAVAPALASAATPTLGIGAYTNLEIEVTPHIAEHVAPDIIEEIKVVEPTIVATPAIVPVVVPRHVNRNRARREQEQTRREHRLNSFHSCDLD